MRPVVFITANQSKHAEVESLLAGIDVRWERLGIARPDAPDLESIARERARLGYAELGVPCFLENTGLYLYDHEGAPGASFKRLWRELGEDGFAKRFGGSRGAARVVVALAEGPRKEDVKTFTGSIAGTLLDAPRGEGGYGWARLWRPDGYDRTLAEMATSTYVVNMRAVPYLALGDHLRGQTFTGTFEAHVTVTLAKGREEEEMDRFQAACAELGVKHIAIELPSGETPRQPMTASFHRGALAKVEAEVVAIAQALARKGFDVPRTKIEAHGIPRDAPESDEEAARAPTTSYFEYHVKLALPSDADLAELGSRCRALGAHLSRNARAGVGKDGLVERFVTLRVHGKGRVTAEERFRELTKMLETAMGELGGALRGRIREYTVFDTNVALDRGWLA